MKIISDKPKDTSVDLSGRRWAITLLGTTGDGRWVVRLLCLELKKSEEGPYGSYFLAEPGRTCDKFRLAEKLGEGVYSQGTRSLYPRLNSSQLKGEKKYLSIPTMFLEIKIIDCGDPGSSIN